MERKHRTKIVVAVIAVVGAIGVAVISNVDKLRSSGKAELTPYNPTNDIEVELRHHVEISGLREAIQTMKKTLENKYRERYKLTDDELACIIDTSFFGNDYIDIVVEAHKKHLTLHEVQELNRLFSSEVMTNYRKKQAVIVQEAMKGMDQLVERKYKTLKKHLQ